MTSITAPSLSLSLFYHDLNQALAHIARKHQINLMAVKSDFNGNSPSGNIVLKAEFKERSKLMEREQFDKIAPHYELGPEDFLATFTFKAQTFRVIGLRIKATSEPLVVQSVKDNKEYTFPIEQYKRLKATKQVSFLGRTRIAA